MCQKRSIQCNRLHNYTMNTLNGDYLSPSSCTVICSWCKYYAQFSIVKPVALFLLFPKIAKAICVCSFLNQMSCPKRLAHGTESCTEISTIMSKTFHRAYNPVTNKGSLTTQSLYGLTNITVHTRVNSLSRDVIFKNSAR